MRNILLGAKYFAIQSNAKEIVTSHLVQALASLQSVNDEAYQTLTTLLEIDEETPKQSILTDELLTETAEAPRLIYSKKVNGIVQLLKLDGYDLSSNITELYLDSAAVKGAYHQIMAQVSEVKALLSSQVFDQEEAIEVVTDAVMQMAWADKANKPKAIFFFLGPPATGKTYLSELLGQGLQGYSFKSIDMTQYVGEEEGFGLTGLRKGYNNAAAGELTEFVKENPKSILVFDEIEKSHTRVQTALLRMLSSGWLQDEYLKEDIDFRDTIVVFTSNLGSELYTNRTFLEQVKKAPHQARDSILEVIRSEKKIEKGHSVVAIPPEMVSRLSQGGVVLFNKLTQTGLARIAQNQFEKERLAFQKKLGIQVEVEALDDLISILVLSFAPLFDTRAMKSRLVDIVFDPITDYLQAHLGIEIDRMSFDISDQIVQFLAENDMKAIVREMELKYQRAFFDFKVVQKDTCLVLEFFDMRIEKLSRGADFTDSSGIVVDLPEVKFSDIAGHEKIKTRLLEVVNLVKHSDTLTDLGEKPPKGMLLYGVPGTGKTLLAKAFANEAGLPFLACSGNDLLDEEFIRKLFARAREYAPALIFIDEIDAVPKRGSGGAYADALVNRLLVEIDGFGSGQSDIFIIAATNRKENIDEAILRSGRIDLHFEVPQLDKGARTWFIQQMLKKSIFDSNIDVDQVVMMTAGMSGADLQKVSRESIIYALRESKDLITEEILFEQINIVKYGQMLSLEDSATRLKETAYHEAGHAILSKIMLPERRIEQITVVARANFLGMVSYDSEQEHDYHIEFLFGLTCVALAGRIAQHKQFGIKGMDSGASGDLEQAARYAWMAIGHWGMDEMLPNLCIAKLQEMTKQPLFTKEIEARVAAWMQRATQRTQELVDEYWDVIEETALSVLEKEVLDESDLNIIFNKH